MENLTAEQYDYGFRLGLDAGRFSAKCLAAGKTTDHGDLLSANDPFADGYRQGLNEGIPKGD